MKISSWRFSKGGLTEMGLSYAERRELQARLEAEGYGVIPNDQYLIDLEDEFKALWREVHPLTMTSPERGYGLYQAVKYLEAAGLEGDFVECGVWKGGSCLLMMRTLELLGRRRGIWLYDTFTGMPEPGEEDIVAWNGTPVRDKWESDALDSWAVGLEQVKENLAGVDYPQELLRFIPGDVAETLHQSAPRKIALLRLDTDWYASTKVELELLYPRLVAGGVLIIDDYGHFEGARQAVDEYFAREDTAPVLFNRLDYTGRIALKP